MGWIEVSAIAVPIVAIVGIIIAAQRYNEGGRSKIYTRFDAYKKTIEDKMEEQFARKDLCKLTHQHVEKELKEIKAQTNLIPGIAAQLRTLVNGKKA